MNEIGVKYGLDIMTSPTLLAGGFSLKRVHLSRNMADFRRLGNVTFFCHLARFALFFSRDFIT